MSQTGKEYFGTQNQTIHKIHCQRWDQQFPHQHNDNPINFPEKNLTQAENYCRNPDSKEQGPWCYTLDPRTSWAYCDIPFCSQ